MMAAVEIEPTTIVIHTGYEFRLKDPDRWNKFKNYFVNEYKTEDLKCMGMRLITGETVEHFNDNNQDYDDIIFGIVFRVSSFKYFTFIYDRYHDYTDYSPDSEYDINYCSCSGFDSMTFDNDKKEMIVKFDSQSG